MKTRYKVITIIILLSFFYNNLLFAYNPQNYKLAKSSNIPELNKYLPLIKDLIEAVRTGKVKEEDLPEELKGLWKLIKTHSMKERTMEVLTTEEINLIEAYIREKGETLLGNLLKQILPSEGRFIGKIVDENGDIITEHIIGKVLGNYLYLWDRNGKKKKPIARIRCKKSYVKEEVIFGLERLLLQLTLPEDSMEVRYIGEIIKHLNNKDIEFYILEEDVKNIYGFANERFFCLYESFLSLPIAFFHEAGESYFQSSSYRNFLSMELGHSLTEDEWNRYKGKARIVRKDREILIPSHTYLRGLGKKARTGERQFSETEKLLPEGKGLEDILFGEENIAVSQMIREQKLITDVLKKLEKEEWVKKLIPKLKNSGFGIRTNKDAIRFLKDIIQAPSGSKLLDILLEQLLRPNRENPNLNINLYECINEILKLLMVLDIPYIKVKRNLGTIHKLMEEMKDALDKRENLEKWRKNRLIMKALVRFFKTIEKAELHHHLDGALSPALILKILCLFPEVRERFVRDFLGRESGNVNEIFSTEIGGPQTEDEWFHLQRELQYLFISSQYENPTQEKIFIKIFGGINSYNRAIEKIKKYMEYRPVEMGTVNIEEMLKKFKLTGLAMYCNPEALRIVARESTLETFYEDNTVLIQQKIHNLTFGYPLSTVVHKVLQGLREAEITAGGRLRTSLIICIFKKPELVLGERYHDVKIQIEEDKRSVEDIKSYILQEVMEMVKNDFPDDKEILEKEKKELDDAINELRRMVKRKNPMADPETIDTEVRKRLLLFWEVRKEGIRQIREIIRVKQQLARDYPNLSDRLIGLDTVGSEVDYITWVHSYGLRLAKRYGFRITDHAGESWPEDDIWQALYRIKGAIETGAVESIGHATALGIHPEALRETKKQDGTPTYTLYEINEIERLQKRLLGDIRKTGIVVETNPSSNLLLLPKYITSYSRHPIQYFWRKLSDLLVVSSDDPHILHTIGLRGEFAKIWLAHPNFKFGELLQIIDNGFRHSFLADTRTEPCKILQPLWDGELLREEKDLSTYSPSNIINRISDFHKLLPTQDYQKKGEYPEELIKLEKALTLYTVGWERTRSGDYGTLVAPAGMPAINMMVDSAIEKKGLPLDEVEIIVIEPPYGCTKNLFENWQRRGVIVHCVNVDEVNEKLPGLINEKTAIIYGESITNPNLRALDIEAVLKINRGRAAVLIDDTFATPEMIRSLDYKVEVDGKEYSVDMAMLGLTKGLTGTGNIISGAVCAKKEWLGLLARHRNCLPENAEIIRGIRGLRYFEIRFKAQSKNAKGLINHIGQSNLIEETVYPKNGHMIYFVFKKLPNAVDFINLLSKFRTLINAVSLGQVRNLFERPSGGTHFTVDESSRQKGGISPAGIRGSIGIENLEEVFREIDAMLKIISIYGGEIPQEDLGDINKIFMAEYVTQEGGKRTVKYLLPKWPIPDATFEKLISDLPSGERVRLTERYYKDSRFRNVVDILISATQITGYDPVTIANHHRLLWCLLSGDHNSVIASPIESTTTHKQDDQDMQKTFLSILERKKKGFPPDGCFRLYSRLGRPGVVVFELLMTMLEVGVEGVLNFDYLGTSFYSERMAHKVFLEQQAEIVMMNEMIVKYNKSAEELEEMRQKDPIQYHKLQQEVRKGLDKEIIIVTQPGSPLFKEAMGLIQHDAVKFRIITSPDAIDVSDKTVMVYFDSLRFRGTDPVRIRDIVRKKNPDCVFGITDSFNLGYENPRPERDFDFITHVIYYEDSDYGAVIIAKNNKPLTQVWNNPYWSRKNRGVAMSEDIATTAMWYVLPYLRVFDQRYDENLDRVTKILNKVVTTRRLDKRNLEIVFKDREERLRFLSIARKSKLITVFDKVQDEYFFINEWTSIMVPILDSNSLILRIGIEETEDLEREFRDIVEELKPPTGGVILVNLNHSSVFRSIKPLGLARIGANLKKNGVDTHYIDAQGKELSPIELVQEVLKAKDKIHGPTILGISVLPGDAGYLKEFLDSLPQTLIESKDFYICAGGYLPTMSISEFMGTFYQIDFVIRGEGEKAILELVDVVNGKRVISEVSNLVYRDEEGAIVINPHHVLTKEELDNLPPPDYSILLQPDDVYLKKTLLDTSRGWPGNCRFCGLHRFFGENTSKTRELVPLKDLRWRSRGPKNVVDEMEKLHREFGITGFDIVDDDFIGLDPNRARAIAREIISRRLKISFWCLSRPDSIVRAGKEILQLLKWAGLKMVFLGAESFDLGQLRFYRKGFQPDVNIQAIELLKKVGIDIRIGFINFYRDSTLEQIERNIGFIENLGLVASIPTPSSILKVYKNTPLYDLYIKEGIPLVPVGKDAFICAFVDKKVEFLYKITRQLAERSYPLMAFFKELQEMQYYSPTGLSAKAKEVYEGLKQIEFLFFKEVLKMVKEKPMDELVESDFSVLIDIYYQLMIDKIKEFNTFVEESGYDARYIRYIFPEDKLLSAPLDEVYRMLEENGDGWVIFGDFMKLWNRNSVYGIEAVDLFLSIVIEIADSICKEYGGFARQLVADEVVMFLPPILSSKRVKETLKRIQQAIYTHFNQRYGFASLEVFDEGALESLRRNPRVKTIQKLPVLYSGKIVERYFILFEREGEDSKEVLQQICSPVQDKVKAELDFSILAPWLPMGAVRASDVSMEGCTDKRDWLERILEMASYMQRIAKDREDSLVKVGTKEDIPICKEGQQKEGLVDKEEKERAIGIQTLLGSRRYKVEKIYPSYMMSSLGAILNDTIFYSRKDVMLGRIDVGYEVVDEKKIEDFIKSSGVRQIRSNEEGKRIFGFKAIDGTYGHTIGNELILLLNLYLHEEFNGFPGVRVDLIRSPPDKFYLVFEGLLPNNELLKILGRVEQKINKKLKVLGVKVNIELSILRKSQTEVKDITREKRHEFVEDSIKTINLLAESRIEDIKERRGSIVLKDYDRIPLKLQEGMEEERLKILAHQRERSKAVLEKIGQEYTPQRVLATQPEQKRPVILLLGYPASGKSTVLEILASIMKIPSISLGATIRGYLKSNPDLIVLNNESLGFDILGEKIRTGQLDVGDGLIIDANPPFPGWDRIFYEFLEANNLYLAGVVHVKVDEDTARKRMLERKRPEDLQMDQQGRLRIEGRIENYKKNVAPLIEHYSKKGYLFEIENTFSGMDALAGSVKKLAEKLKGRLEGGEKPIPPLLIHYDERGYKEEQFIKISTHLLEKGEKKLSVNRFLYKGRQFIQIGSRVYEVKEGTSQIDIKDLLKDPLLWIGNAQLVDFYGEEMLKEQEGHQTGLRLVEWDEEMRNFIEEPELIDNSIILHAYERLKDPQLDPLLRLHYNLVVYFYSIYPSNEFPITSLDIVSGISEKSVNEFMFKLLGITDVLVPHIVPTQFKKFYVIIRRICELCKVEGLESSGMPIEINQQNIVMHRLNSILMQMDYGRMWRLGSLEEINKEINRITGEDINLFSYDNNSKRLIINLHTLSKEKRRKVDEVYVFKKRGPPRLNRERVIVEALNHLCRKGPISVVNSICRAIRYWQDNWAIDMVLQGIASNPWIELETPQDDFLRDKPVGFGRPVWVLGGGCIESAIWVRDILNYIFDDIKIMAGVDKNGRPYIEDQIEFGPKVDRETDCIGEPAIDKYKWRSLVERLFTETELSEEELRKLQDEYNSAVMEIKERLKKWILENNLRIVIFGQIALPDENPVFYPALLEAVKEINQIRNPEDRVVVFIRHNYTNKKRRIRDGINIHVLNKDDPIYVFVESEENAELFKQYFGFRPTVIYQATRFPEVDEKSEVPFRAQIRNSKSNESARDEIEGILKEKGIDFEKDIIIIHPSRLDTNKRPDSTITLAKNLQRIENQEAHKQNRSPRKVRILFIGTQVRQVEGSFGRETERKALEEVTRMAKEGDIDISSQVHFLGYLPHHLTTIALTYAHIVSIPSEHETFGRIPMEAMAMGVPIIYARDWLYTFNPEDRQVFYELYGGNMIFRIRSGRTENGKWVDGVLKPEIEEDGIPVMHRKIYEVINNPDAMEQIARMNFLACRRSMFNLQNTENFMRLKFLLSLDPSGERLRFRYRPRPVHRRSEDTVGRSNQEAIGKGSCLEEKDNVIVEDLNKDQSDTIKKAIGRIEEQIKKAELTDEEREQALQVVELLKDYLNMGSIKVFDAVVKGPEDYLLAFYRPKDSVIALAKDFLDSDYIIDFWHRLPEILFHEGYTAKFGERDYEAHRNIYMGIQARIFGKYASTYLTKKDLRCYINLKTKEEYPIEFDEATSGDRNLNLQMIERLLRDKEFIFKTMKRLGIPEYKWRYLRIEKISVTHGGTGSQKQTLHIKVSGKMINVEGDIIYIRPKIGVDFALKVAIGHAASVGFAEAEMSEIETLKILSGQAEIPRFGVYVEDPKNNFYVYSEEWINGPTAEECFKAGELTLDKVTDIVSAYLSVMAKLDKRNPFISHVKYLGVSDVHGRNVMFKNGSKAVVVDIGKIVYISPLYALQEFDRYYGRIEGWTETWRKQCHRAIFDGVIKTFGEKRGIEFLEEALNWTCISQRHGRKYKKQETQDLSNSLKEYIKEIYIRHFTYVIGTWLYNSAFEILRKLASGEDIRPEIEGLKSQLQDLSNQTKTEYENNTSLSNKTQLEVIGLIYESLSGEGLWDVLSESLFSLDQIERLLELSFLLEQVSKGKIYLTQNLDGKEVIDFSRIRTNLRGHIIYKQIRESHTHPPKSTLDALRLNPKDVYLNIGGGPGILNIVACLRGVRKSIYVDVSESNLAFVVRLKKYFDYIKDNKQLREQLENGTPDVIQFIRNVMEKIGEEVKVRDGVTSQDLIKNTNLYFGQEELPKGILESPYPPLEIHIADAVSLPLKDDSVTKVSVLELFHWLSLQGGEGKIIHSIREILRVTQEGGLILIRPDYKSMEEFIDKYLPMIASIMGITVRLKGITPLNERVFEVVDKSGNPNEAIKKVAEEEIGIDISIEELKQQKDILGVFKNDGVIDSEDLELAEKVAKIIDSLNLSDREKVRLVAIVLSIVQKKFNEVRESIGWYIGQYVRLMGNVRNDGLKHVLIDKDCLPQGQQYILDGIEWRKRQRILERLFPGYRFDIFNGTLDEGMNQENTIVITNKDVEINARLINVTYPGEDGYCPIDGLITLGIGLLNLSSEDNRLRGIIQNIYNKLTGGYMDIEKFLRTKKLTIELQPITRFDPELERYAISLLETYA